MSKGPYPRSTDEEYLQPRKSVLAGFAASHYEAGLGHSDMGADTVFLNPEFFRQFCPLVLDTTVCQQGFGNLDIGEQEMLRGALVNKVNAACPECPMGIDLQQANFSISIFLAACWQIVNR